MHRFNTTSEFTDAVAPFAQDCRHQIERAISDAVCSVVDDLIVPEVVEDAGHENLHGIAQMFLHDAAGALASEIDPKLEDKIERRVFERFQQHIAGECADDEETSECLRTLRVEIEYWGACKVISAAPESAAAPALW